MTFCADSNKFIKDLLDAKYKKIEDAISEMEENADVLLKDAEGATGHQKERFVAAARKMSRFLLLRKLRKRASIGETGR